MHFLPIGSTWTYASSENSTSFKNIFSFSKSVLKTLEFEYHVSLIVRNISSSYCVIFPGEGYVWKELLLVTEISTTWRVVKRTVFVSQWYYKSGALKVNGLFNHDDIGWKTQVINSQEPLVSSIFLLWVKSSQYD